MKNFIESMKELVEFAVVMPVKWVKKHWKGWITFVVVYNSLLYTHYVVIPKIKLKIDEKKASK